MMGVQRTLSDFAMIVIQKGRKINKGRPFFGVSAMVFSNPAFVYIFLPVFLVAYYLVPGRWKNEMLFLGSMVFYTVGSWKHPMHILVFFLCLVVNWAVARVMELSRFPKLWLIVGLIYDFGFLIYFKYAGFLVKEIAGTALSIILPIGISFYTFQAVSYIADVYRGTCPAERSFIKFGAYLSMFPQLIAGPIVTYPTVRRNMTARVISWKGFYTGTQIFILGLGSKLVLANQIGGLWHQVQMIGFESVSVPLAWLGIIAYSFQLYFDFYGYSLMAIGLGEMLGFKFPVNFDHPYVSVSMTEFWRRWHMTLGSWFREYVYFPLGGSRVSRGKIVRNLLIVWLLTGIWHGAGYNFLIWGFVLFAIMVVERFWIKDFLERHRWFGHLYMIVLIPLTWAIFVNTDFSQLGLFFRKLFFLVPSASVLVPGDWLKYLTQYWPLLIACVFFSTPLFRRFFDRFRHRIPGYIALALIFGYCVYCMYMGMNDPFLYFQF